MWLLAACNPSLPDLHDAARDLTGALPVFPGAEGFGTDTPAGRGGAVLIVDSLAAAGPGSLREALETPGPRTVLFSVGGVIRLDEMDGLSSGPGSAAPGRHGRRARGDPSASRHSASAPIVATAKVLSPRRNA